MKSLDSEYEVVEKVLFHIRTNFEEEKSTGLFHEGYHISRERLRIFETGWVHHVGYLFEVYKAIYYSLKRFLKAKKITTEVSRCCNYFGPLFTACFPHHNA